MTNTNKTLALIHTSATLAPVFNELCATHIPHVKTFNMVDESLIKNTIACGELTPDTARRVVAMAGLAQDAGADYVLFTCSSIGAAVETAASVSHIPVLRVDKPMADKAVAMGSTIGVVATLSTTLHPTVDLVRRCATAAGKEVTVIPHLCEGAFEALMSGDAATHDKRVLAGLQNLMQSSQVILLAQASMARVVGLLAQADKKVPILASPPLAMEYLSTVL